MKKISMIGKDVLGMFLFVSIFVFLSSSTAYTQWANTYGTGNFDYSSFIQQTSDGGFIVVGGTDPGTYKHDVMILKLDPNGDIQWQKTYGGDGNDDAYSIQQTSDGGYILAGKTDSFGGRAVDAWVLKLDASGNIGWQKTYGNNKFDCAYSIQQTSDGGYVFVGEREDETGQYRSALVFKLDFQGNIQWQKRYGSGTSYHNARYIQQTSDGGYVVVGGAPQNSGEIWVFKLNSNGDYLWQKRYGGAAYEIGNFIQQTSDGGYIVAGTTHSFGAGDSDALILKLNASGNIEWQKSYGGADWDIISAIQQTDDDGDGQKDDGYIAAGKLTSSITGYDAWVLKLDNSGNIQWQNIYGDPTSGYTEDTAFSIQQTPDGFIVSGRTYSVGAGNCDAFVLKLDSNGNNCWIMGTAVAYANNTSAVQTTTTAIAAVLTAPPITSSAILRNPVNQGTICQ